MLENDTVRTWAVQAGSLSGWGIRELCFLLFLHCMQQIPRQNLFAIHNKILGWSRFSCSSPPSHAAPRPWCLLTYPAGLVSCSPLVPSASRSRKIPLCLPGHTRKGQGRKLHRSAPRRAGRLLPGSNSWIYCSVPTLCWDLQLCALGVVAASQEMLWFYEVIDD